MKDSEKKEEKKSNDLKVENKAFSLTVHLNANFIGTQVCIIVACILCIMLVDVDVLIKLAKVLLALDIVSVIATVVLSRDKKPTPKKEKVKKKESSTDVSDVAHVETKSQGMAPHEESGEIRNKLALAQPSAHRSLHMDECVEATTILPDEAPIPVESTVSTEVRNSFEQFFDFDDFDD